MTKTTGEIGLHLDSQLSSNGFDVKRTIMNISRIIREIVSLFETLEHICPEKLRPNKSSIIIDIPDISRAKPNQLRSLTFVGFSTIDRKTLFLQFSDGTDTYLWNGLYICPPHTIELYQKVGERYVLPSGSPQAFLSEILY